MLYRSAWLARGIFETCDVARGSLAESQNHLQDAVDRGYLDPMEFARLNSVSERAAAATARLQRYLRGPQR